LPEKYNHLGLMTQKITPKFISGYDWAVFDFKQRPAASRAQFFVEVNCFLVKTLKIPIPFKCTPTD